ncbi:MAG: hypothetical protein R2794_12195 [Chitinophagales bacterium]
MSVNAIIDNPKRSGGILFILVATVAIFLSNRNKVTDQDDMRDLDAKLLSDLQHADIGYTDAVKATMLENNISVDDLKPLLTVEHVDYDACDPGNCHYTSYTIEGKTKNGKQVRFKIDSGEDGEDIQMLEVRE